MDPVRDVRLSDETILRDIPEEVFGTISATHMDELVYASGPLRSGVSVLPPSMHPDLKDLALVDRCAPPI